MTDSGESTPTLSARQLQGRQSRERILDAVERLIAERGYASTSISMIAKSSGLPASSIYWHFSSKEELLGAVVERGATQWLAAQPRWSSFDGDLGGFLDAVGDGVASQPPFVRLLMQLMLEGPEGAPAGPRSKMQDVWRNVRTGLERVMTDHFELGRNAADRRLARRLAQFMLTCMDGAVVDTYFESDVDPAVIVADLHVSLKAIAELHRGGRS